MSRRTRALAPVAALAFLALAGCGLPAEQGPVAIPRSQVPFHLLSPVAGTTTTAAPRVVVHVPLYFLTPAGTLGPVGRDVPFPDSLAVILDALLDGPDRTESGAGLTTALPAQARVLSAAQTGPNTVTVNLSSPFGQISGPAQVQAVAQVVATVNAHFYPASTGVLFQIDGHPVAVPVGNGQQVSSPVYPFAYPAQYGLSTPPPTTTTTTAPPAGA